MFLVENSMEISISKYVKINDVKILLIKTAIKANTAKFLSIKAIHSLGFPSDSLFVEKEHIFTHILLK